MCPYSPCYAFWPVGLYKLAGLVWKLQTATNLLKDSSPKPVYHLQVVALLMAESKIWVAPSGVERVLAAVTQQLRRQLMATAAGNHSFHPAVKGGSSTSLQLKCMAQKIKKQNALQIFIWHRYTYKVYIIIFIYDGVTWDSHKINKVSFVLKSEKNGQCLRLLEHSLHISKLVAQAL